MQPRQSTRDIRAGGEVRSVFLLGSASLQQSRNGPYWRLEARDAAGSVEAKIWSPLSTSFTDLAPGQMVEISARAGLFRDQLQLTVDDLRVLSPEEIGALDLGEFVPASSRPAADMLAEAEALCREVLTYKPWLTFALSVLDDSSIRPRLLVAPAAKGVHHAYAGGLLEHLLSVAGLSMRIADHYPELDRQVLLAGALFHDIGKLDEMNGGLVIDYTDAGRFLGHITQGLLLLEPFLAASGLEPELALHFRHLIASHHGTLEFGSPREPATAEALVLHYADNVDAKMAQWRSLFPAASEVTNEVTSGADNAEPGMEKDRADNHDGVGGEENGMVWSPYQNTLKRALCRPAPTPAAKVFEPTPESDNPDDFTSFSFVSDDVPSMPEDREANEAPCFPEPELQEADEVPFFLESDAIEDHETPLFLESEVPVPDEATATDDAPFCLEPEDAVMSESEPEAQANMTRQEDLPDLALQQEQQEVTTSEVGETPKTSLAPAAPEKIFEATPGDGNAVSEQEASLVGAKNARPLKKEFQCSLL